MPTEDPPSGEPTRADWLRRLAPGDALGDDGDPAGEGNPAGEGGFWTLEVREAGERVTRQPALQRWLREAGFEAARGLEGADAMVEAQAHARMRSGLEERFPALVEAVREATAGCGQLALQWRPIAPNYTQVQVAFEGDLEPDVFCRLPAPALSAVERALRAVAGALPKGEPFPGRPNTATGVLGCEGRCLGVRYLERAEGEVLRRSIVLLPGAGDATDEHREDEAARGVVAYFAPEEREQWYEK